MIEQAGLEQNSSPLKFTPGEAADLSPEERVKSALRTLQKENTVAYKRLMGLLQGGTGGYDDLLRDEGGRIIRHRQELMAQTLLYGTVHYLAHEPKFRAMSLTNATFERYMEAHETTDDGQERRWLEDDGGYKRSRLVQYHRGFDRGKFRRFLNQTADEEEEWQTWSGEPSDITQGFVHFSLALLTNDLPGDSVEGLREYAILAHQIDVEPERLDEALHYSSTLLSPTPSSKVCTPPRVASGEGNQPGTHRETRYPTATEVRDVAQILHPERKPGYHEEVLKKLQREHGEVKMAYCPEYENGERYVYYSQHLPDPQDARDVWVRGEKQDPEPAPSDDATGAEQLVTDGGTPQEETTTQAPTMEPEELGLDDRDTLHATAEMVAAGSLYAAFRHHGGHDIEDAKGLTMTAMTQEMKENPPYDDGEAQRWLREEQPYRDQIIEVVSERFEKGTLSEIIHQRDLREAVQEMEEAGE